MRIVSLLPSATEIVAALGLAGDLVARSHECDDPAEIRRLPAVTAKEIEVTESTPGIQLRAMAPRYRALSAFGIDWDLLRGLHPTHILTQTACAECGVTAEELLGVVAKELFDSPQVFDFRAQSLPEVLAELRAVGAALGVARESEALARTMEERIRKISGLAWTDPTTRPVVGCLEWLKPPMWCGRWIPEMIRLAGGTPMERTVPGDESNRSPWMDWPALVAADPEILVAMPCGWHLPRTVTELRKMAERPEWPALRAVQQHRVYVVDGASYFNRPGPGLVDLLEILAGIIGTDPSGFYRYPGAWTKYPTGGAMA